MSGGICGVSGSGRSFTREEEEALQKDESTSALMNRVRQHAGRSGNVELRGDDKTRRELAEEYNGHVGAAGAAELGKGALIEAPHFMELAGEGALAGAGVVAGAIGTLGLYTAHVHELETQKKELQQAIAKDELHVALLSQLDLPQGYKDIQMRRRPDAGQGWQSDAQKMATQFASKDKALVATLQLHADRGMHEALDMRASGMTKEAFLAKNPAVANAYKADAAFREGFDATVWSPSSELPNIKKGLEERDARYACVHVNVRV